MKKIFRENGLSIIFFLLFLLSMAGQACTGWQEYNSERKENGATAVTLRKYFSSGHFIQATFENWESEFLQMGLFVVFTISLRQKGSSESKKLDEDEEKKFPKGKRHGL